MVCSEIIWLLPQSAQNWKSFIVNFACLTLAGQAGSWLSPWQNDSQFFISMKYKLLSIPARRTSGPTMMSTSLIRTRWTPSLGWRRARTWTPVCIVRFRRIGIGFRRICLRWWFWGRRGGTIQCLVPPFHIFFDIFFFVPYIPLFVSDHRWVTMTTGKHVHFICLECSGWGLRSSPPFVMVRGNPAWWRWGGWRILPFGCLWHCFIVHKGFPFWLPRLLRNWRPLFGTFSFMRLVLLFLVFGSILRPFGTFIIVNRYDVPSRIVFRIKPLLRLIVVPTTTTSTTAVFVPVSRLWRSPLRKTTILSSSGHYYDGKQRPNILILYTHAKKSSTGVHVRRKTRRPTQSSREITGERTRTLWSAAL